MRRRMKKATAPKQAIATPDSRLQLCGFPTRSYLSKFCFWTVGRVMDQGATSRRNPSCELLRKHARTYMRPCTLRCTVRPGRAAESVRSRDDWMWQQMVEDRGTRSRSFCRLGWEAGKSRSYRTRCTLVFYYYEEQGVVGDVVWGFCVTMHAARACRGVTPTS